MNPTPLLARTLPGLVALAAASLTGPAAAQSGHRMMVVDEGEGPSILSVDMPDIRALRTPDFVRDDMPLFDRKLRLEAAQRTTVRTLLDDYLEAFAALATTHLPSGGAGMIFGGGEGGFFRGDDDGDGEHGGGGVFLHALGGPDGALGDWSAGTDGPARIAITIAASDGGGETVDVEAGPGAGVTIALETPDGEEIPEEVRKQLEEKAREIAERIQEQMENAEGEGIGPGFDPLQARQAMEEKARQFEELAARAEEFADAKEDLRVAFVNDVQAQLEDPQLERWPSLERTLQRHKTLPNGRLDGERTDLIAVADTLDLPTAGTPEVVEQLESYELAMEEVLTRRNAFVGDATKRVNHAVNAGDTDKALSIVDQATRLRRAVRDVNARFTETIASELGPHDATAFEGKVLRTSYPRVYKKTHALESFEAARQLEGLQEETLLSILELEQLYRSELDTANTRIRRAIDRHQPGQARRSIEQIGVAMLGQSMDLGDETDPIREAFAKRRELDHRSVKNLYAMLTPEQVTRLPKIPARKNQPFIIEKWSGSVPD